MQLEYDREADAVYVRIRNLPYAFGVDLDHARRIDYAPDHQPIGVELLNVSRGVNLADLPDSTEIERVLRDVGIRVLARQA
jgi:uncharacterized protein YuzE